MTGSSRPRPSAAAGDAGGRLEGLRVHPLGPAHRIHVADSRRARTRGLARLDALPVGSALHIPRCRSVHTFTMRFALDLVWLDRGGRVVRVDRAVPARRLRTCLRARSVVECDAGTADGFVAAGLEDLRLG